MEFVYQNDQNDEEKPEENKPEESKKEGDEDVENDNGDTSTNGD